MNKKNLIVEFFFGSKISTLLLIIFSFLAVTVNSQTLIPKKAGISIRVDDNATISDYKDFLNVFNKYNYKFGIALNLGNVDFLNQSYTDSIRKFQSEGIEIMDHTPNHRTNYFHTLFNPSEYLGLIGVDHVIGNKICLEFEQPNILSATKTGFININTNKITSVTNGEFSSFRLYIDQYLYLPSLSKIVLISSMHNDDSLSVFDVWQDSIDLGNHSNIQYYLFDYYTISITQDAYKILGKESLKLASYYNLQRPVTWIQPGGIFWPQPSADFVKVPLGDSLNYLSGAMYQNTAFKVFNEHDPLSDRSFGMNWGDFSEEFDDIDLLKKKIADGIAKNKVMIGNNHFDVGNPRSTNWPLFLEKMDQLLQWCFAKNIPVKTYSEWANILYNETADPTTNIFPSIDNDLNEDGDPDGYILFPAFASVDDLDGPAGVNTRSFTMSEVGPFFFIYELGGLEKGTNHFEIWTKGNSGNIIEVKITYTGVGDQVFRFAVGSSDWEKQTLLQSINGNTSLVIPSNVSVANIIVSTTTYAGGSVKVSGMKLIKQDPLPVELSAFTATIISASVNLKWRTETEINNYGFEVQKFENNIWNVLGFVNGNGNSNIPKEYSFKDDELSHGKNSYRLKQIDNDGQFEYSNIVDVNFGVPNEFSLNQNFPNPFNPNTVISFSLPYSGNVKLAVFNILGEEIMVLLNENKESGLHNISFNASDLNSGVYLYKLEFTSIGGIRNNVSQIKKMILIK